MDFLPAKVRAMVVAACALIASGPLDATVGPVVVENNAEGGFAYRSKISTRGSLRTAINLGHNGGNVVMNGVTFLPRLAFPPASIFPSHLHTLCSCGNF